MKEKICEYVHHKFLNDEHIVSEKDDLIIIKIGPHTKFHKTLWCYYVSFLNSGEKNDHGTNNRKFIKNRFTTIEIRYRENENDTLIYINKHAAYLKNVRFKRK